MTVTFPIIALADNDVADAAWFADITEAVNALKVSTDALAPGPWNTITLLAGWTNRAGYAVASYRKIFDGTALHVVINLSAGTQTNGTTIFTLPTGFRPLSTVQMTISTRIAATPQQMGALEIDTSGNAKIFDIGASLTIHANGILALNI